MEQSPDGFLLQHIAAARVKIAAWRSVGSRASNHRFARFGSALVAVIAIAECGRAVVAGSDSDPVTSRGLEHTTAQRELVATAIDRANQILGRHTHRLQPAWRGRRSATRSAAVPVYLVQSPTSAASTPAAVPRGCVCVFVNPSRLSAWVEANSRGQVSLGLDAGYLLTFMLLHEVGHIDAGSAAADFVNGGLSQLNVEPARQKADEERADAFAADLIRRVAYGKTVSDASLAANFVASELSKLSWNMQAYRSLEEFGAAATGKRAVFFDRNYSHPNLAWRVLRANDLIQRTPETRQLLDNFEAVRRRADKRPGEFGSGD